MQFRTHIRKNLHLAFPVMLSQMGHILVNIADSMMVGQLGKTELGAVSFSTNLFMVIMTLGVGISLGITTLVAQNDGKKDYNKITAIGKSGFAVMTITGLLLCLLCYVLSFHLNWFGQPSEILDYSKSYLQIMAVSLIPMMIFQAGRQLAEGLSLTKQSMYISMATNILNILLNDILINGRFGLTAYGVLGAGYATLISRAVMMLAMLVFIAKSHHFTPIRNLIGKTHDVMSNMKRILKIGLPSGMQAVTEAAAFSTSGLMAGWISTTALAAHQITLSCSSVAYMMTTGLGTAATIRVANFFGIDDKSNVRKAGFSNILLSIGVMVTSATIIFLFNHLIPTLFIGDREVIALSAQLLLLCALFQIADGVQVTAMSALRGLEDVTIPTIFLFIAFWVISLPLGYFLSFYQSFGVNGIWIGLLVGLSVTALLSTLRFRKLTLLV